MVRVRHLSFALLLVAAGLLAGCTDSDASDAPGVLADLRFEPMRVTLTPQEEGETAGTIDIAWGDVGMILHSANPAEFPFHAILAEDTFYLSTAGHGWIRYGLEDARVLTFLQQAHGWDLPSLVAHPSLEATERRTEEGMVVTGSGVYPTGTGETPFTLRMVVDDGRILNATVTAQGARENPFHFAPGPGPGMPDQLPEDARDADEVIAMDAKAQEAHSVLVQLITDYRRNHGGLLPERVDQDELRVELLASGASWPTNPYTEEPLAAGDEPGAFEWTRCEPTLGTYVANGWGGLLFDNTWGSGQCP